MLAVSHGKLIAASTPFGTRGWWYEAYISNQKYGGWDYYEINAEQAPLITPEFLEEERRELGAFWFAQEYMCKFLDSQGAAFRAVDIEAALGLDYETWDMRDVLREAPSTEAGAGWDLSQFMSV
jgi:hypothetical protein